MFLVEETWAMQKYKKKKKYGHMKVQGVEKKRKKCEHMKVHKK
jgi:hypothetical protein